MPQETFPDNFHVKVPSVCQSVCQVNTELKIKEGTQLKCQIYFQYPIQGPHQLISQINSIRYKRGFPKDMPSIMIFRDKNKEPITYPVLGDSNGYPSDSPSDNPTKYPSPVPIIKPSHVSGKTLTKNPSRVPQ